MGVYTDGTRVLEMLLNLKVGTAPRLSASEIEPIVEALETEINGLLLAQGYRTVPATGVHDVAMLCEAVNKKAAADVFLRLNQPTRAPDVVKSWASDYEGLLERLRRGQQRLVDQSPGVGQDGEGRMLGLKLGQMLTEE